MSRTIGKKTARHPYIGNIQRYDCPRSDQSISPILRFLRCPKIEVKMISTPTPRKAKTKNETTSARTRLPPRFQKLHKILKKDCNRHGSDPSLLWRRIRRLLFDRVNVNITDQRTRYI